MNTDRFKFRVWDNDAEEYIDDGALLDGRTGKISGNGNYTIKQCTGVRDKNGKLIAGDAPKPSSENIIEYIESKLALSDK